MFSLTTQTLRVHGLIMIEIIRRETEGRTWRPARPSLWQPEPWSRPPGTSSWSWSGPSPTPAARSGPRSAARYTEDGEDNKGGHLLNMWQQLGNGPETGFNLICSTTNVIRMCCTPAIMECQNLWVRTRAALWAERQRNVAGRNQRGGVEVDSELMTREQAEPEEAHCCEWSKTSCL